MQAMGTDPDHNHGTDKVICLFSNIYYLLNNKVIYNFWIIGLTVGKDKADTLGGPW
jgi:hypothetical protein